MPEGQIDDKYIWNGVLLFRSFKQLSRIILRRLMGFFELTRFPSQEPETSPWTLPVVKKEKQGHHH